MQLKSHLHINMHHEAGIFVQAGNGTDQTKPMPETKF
jgi:hypothetical protein